MDIFKYFIKRKHVSTLFYAGDINEISNVWTTNVNLTTLFDTMDQARRVIDVMAANNIPGRYNVNMAQVSENSPYQVHAYL